PKGDMADLSPGPLVEDSLHAERQPIRRPDNKALDAAKATTRKLISIASVRGTLVGIMPTSVSIANHRTTVTQTPLSNAVTPTSIKRSLTKSQRVAPTAALIATSCLRRASVVIRMLATLAHVAIIIKATRTDSSCSV